MHTTPDTRYRPFVVFFCTLFASLLIGGCGGGSGSGSGNSAGGTGGPGGGPGSGPDSATMVTLRGKVDDGTANSPIANALCRFRDRTGAELATATADAQGLFRLVVPPESQGFLRCAPPGLPNLGLATFVSTAGQPAGSTIANLAVTPATTMVADIVATSGASDFAANAAAVSAALAAGDADLTLLAEAETTLYNAQLSNRLNVDFSGGSEGGAGGSDGSDGGGGSDGAGSSDSGGASGEAGDGGAFSPIPGALCDFTLRLDGPMLSSGALADFLADGSVDRPDLQAIAPRVNAQFASRQTALAAAFRRQFPNGLGRPIGTTADANGVYFLPTPTGVPGFVRCRPPDTDNLVLSRFVPARRPNEQLRDQDVTPPTTVISTVVTQALRAGLDPVDIQNGLLAALNPLQIFLPNHPNGNGLFATVQVTPGATLSNPDFALLAFAATTIFDTMRLQRADIPSTIPFLAAFNDYIADASFTPPLAPLTPAVDAAINQGQAVIGRGRGDLGIASTTATLVGTVTDANGTPLAGIQVNATQQGITVQTAITDVNGAFILSDMPPGITTVATTLGASRASVTLNVIAVPVFSITLSLGFTAPAPTLSAVSPSDGPTTGGTVLRLSGSNFQVGATVTIGGTAATAVTVTSST